MHVRPGMARPVNGSCGLKPNGLDVVSIIGYVYERFFMFVIVKWMEQQSDALMDVW